MLVRIPITQFDHIIGAMPVPLYVVVAGGIAVGKSHVVHKHLTRFVIADIDDYMTRNGFTDYNREGEQFGICMKQIDADIQRYKRDRKSMVAMGTGANFDFLKFRLEEARSHRYRTAILHVTGVPYDKAVEQNAIRRERGEHAVAPGEEQAIALSLEQSAASVERIQREHPELIDFICIHENVRG